MIETLQVKNQTIVVDSCILLYCEAYSFKQDIRNFLRTLDDYHNRLVISKISYFEVLSKCEKKFEKYFLKLLRYLDNIEVSEEIILNARVLYQAYYKAKINNLDKISPADFIIGGTCTNIKDSLVLTADKNHFPKPIWTLRDNKYIIDRFEDRYSLINIFIFQPNINIINDLVKV